MDIVIDIQGYRGCHGNFIAKEIAILSLKSGFIGPWILQPSEYLKFPHKYQKEYNWLATNHHKIEWGIGKDNFQKLMCNLRDIISKSDRVFVRGSCKANFIQRHTGKKVINLTEEQDGCPSFRQMDKSSVMCDYHASLEDEHPNKHLYCPLTQAHQQRNWILRNSSVEAWFDNNV